MQVRAALGMNGLPPSVAGFQASRRQLDHPSPLPPTYLAVPACPAARCSARGRVPCSLTRSAPSPPPSSRRPCPQALASSLASLPYFASPLRLGPRSGGTAVRFKPGSQNSLCTGKTRLTTS
jgi:hypothetical protein